MLIGSAQARSTTHSKQTNSTDRLDGFEEQLVQSSGHIATLRLAGLERTGVFNAPLGLFWTLIETDHTVTEVVSLSRLQGQLYLERDCVILLHQPPALDHVKEMLDPTQHGLIGRFVSRSTLRENI